MRHVLFILLHLLVAVTGGWWVLLTVAWHVLYTLDRHMPLGLWRLCHKIPTAQVDTYFQSNRNMNGYNQKMPYSHKFEDDYYIVKDTETGAIVHKEKIK